MPEPLPPILEPALVTALPYSEDLACTPRAYSVCLEAEQYWAQSSDKLALVRLVGWMLQKAPSAVTRELIARELLSAAVANYMEHACTLGQFYAGHYIRICAY
jgi:hypothetical protein